METNIISNAIEGQEIYNYMGSRVHKPASAYVHLKAEMVHFASEQGILTPRVLGCCDVEPEVIATVTDVEQLKKQVRLFRTIAQPYIGRVGHQGTFDFFDRLHFHFMGPSESEEELDEFCLARVKSPTSRSLWKRLLPKMCAKSSGRFVLVHGDFAARNIMVHNGELSAIDWEYSGFYPEYMEYALATVIHNQHEDSWLPVLKEIMEPCGFKRSRLMAAVKDRGW
ncbi:hypothetical protein BDV06DRAFT_215313 [Aspergillus oleicola]